MVSFKYSLTVSRCTLLAYTDTQYSAILYIRFGYTLVVIFLLQIYIFSALLVFNCFSRKCLLLVYSDSIEVLFQKYFCTLPILCLINFLFSSKDVLCVTSAMLSAYINFLGTVSHVCYVYIYIKEQLLVGGYFVSAHLTFVNCSKFLIKYNFLQKQYSGFIVNDFRYFKKKTSSSDCIISRRQVKKNCILFNFFAGSCFPYAL